MMRFLPLFSAASAAFLLAATLPAADHGISSRPLPAPSTAPDDAERSPLFELLPPASTGIHFVHPIDLDHPRKHLYVGGYASAGIAIGDLNGDRLQDLFMTGGPVRNRLYLQDADAAGGASMRFRDATETAGVDGGDGWAAGATLVDIDGDGDLDIYVCRYDAPNQLFVNETTSPAAVRFVERAGEFGLDLVDASFVSAFCDFDLDGDLDVFVCAYQYVNPAGRPAELPVARRDGQYFVLPEFKKYYGIVTDSRGGQVFRNVGRRDYLLENTAANTPGGQPHFRDVTRQAGISGLGVGNSMLWWDFDQDGWSDLYIANDFKVADQLYRNNGDGTFTDVARTVFPHTTWFSMGSEAGDVNNDGRLDLLVTDMAGTTHYRAKVTMGEMGNNRDFLKTANPPQYMRNALFVNTGTPRFLEAAYLAGVAHSDWSWATKLADLDNDGRLDVFITNGAARMFNHSDRQFTHEQRIGKTQWELWEDTGPRREENLAFRNRGDLEFEDVSDAWGLRKNGMSYAAAYGDLDDDGDLDLVVANLDEPVSVYRNRSHQGRRLRVELVGGRGNRAGLGAEIRLETARGRQVRQMMPTMGFMSCNEPVAHFGLGEEDQVARLTVIWPGGMRQTFDDLKADHVYTITQPAAKAEPPRRDVDDAPSDPWFVTSRVFPALRHQEIEFDDFTRQPLLPYKHSQLGPGLAVGDVDGDGDLDVYHGRARGSRRAVYENLGRGRLGVKSILDSQTHEDMGALFFDVDRDGDRDLYVVSGGVECEPEDPVLRDRLYLNDGAGKFTLAPEAALPDLRDSGSVVCAADFDRDGDLDLFVGGRVVPGRYPVSPRSRLLRNQSRPGAPKLVDVTSNAAGQLLETGLVTSALWSDADGDGWVDLLVTHEWGAVKYYRNEPRRGDQNSSSRRLVDRTREAGLSHRLGWWNGVAGGDVDRDGDQDYVVSNFGLNTMYHASDEKPELLYYGVFDDSGKPRLLEAKYEDDKCFPRRGLSCSSDAMPFVREKMRTFHNFGLATLQEIYTPDRLSRAMQFTANTLESGVLLNQGPTGDASAVPKFQFQPLPRLAQISPSFGVTVHDFDADGWLDCFLAQNFFSPQLETGRMDSGLSLLLRGHEVSPGEPPGFEPVWPRESGILIAGDAKASSLADFNEDGWSDLLVTLNNAPIQAYESRPRADNRRLNVRLVGPPGNLDCVGAVVTVHFADAARPQVAEVTAGGGYLSQSSAVLSFGCGKSTPRRVTIRWPDGRQVTEHALTPGQFDVTLRRP